MKRDESKKGSNGDGKGRRGKPASAPAKASERQVSAASGQVAGSRESTAPKSVDPGGAGARSSAPTPPRGHTAPAPRAPGAAAPAAPASTPASATSTATGAGAGQRSAPAAPAEAPPRRRLSHDEIARRAYSLYEQRGHTSGRDVDDWLQAERDLLRGSRDSEA